jgi:hypothetical protein
VRGAWRRRIVWREHTSLRERGWRAWGIARCGNAATHVCRKFLRWLSICRIAIRRDQMEDDGKRRQRHRRAPIPFRSRRWLMTVGQTSAQTLIPARQLADMPSRFPGESAAYRSARNALLAEEIELRRHIERVAAQLTVSTARPGR